MTIGNVVLTIDNNQLTNKKSPITRNQFKKTITSFYKNEELNSSQINFMQRIVMGVVCISENIKE